MSLIERKEITTAEAKKLLEVKEENLDPLQRRVLDYTIKFSKLPADKASQLLQELIRDGLLDQAVAVQIVNSMPTSVEEIRTFIGRHRIISEEAVRAIMEIVDKHRSGQ